MTDYNRFLSPTGRQLTNPPFDGWAPLSRGTGDMVRSPRDIQTPRSFPWQELREISVGLLDGHDATRSSTDRPADIGRCSNGTRRPRRAIHPRDARRLIVTSGSQQGIDLIARVFISPGDVVLVELPTFTGGIAAFKNVQAELAGVARTQTASASSISTRCGSGERAQARPSSCSTHSQLPEPHRHCSDLSKRARLLEWAARRDVLIVEDDPYGSSTSRMWRATAETRPISADDRRAASLSEHGFEDAGAGLSGRMDGGAGGAHRAFRHGEAIHRPDVGHPRSAHRARGVRRASPIALAPQPAGALPAQARRDGERSARSSADRACVADAQGRVLHLGHAADGYTDTAAARASAPARRVFVVGSAFHVDGTGTTRFGCRSRRRRPNASRRASKRLAEAFA